MEKIDPNDKNSDNFNSKIDDLRILFPEAFNEGILDFNILREILSGKIEVHSEKYNLNWHGKSSARRHALIPTRATLRPDPKNSVEYNTTKNVVIDGDNLEVLKLLQRSYSNAVKLIYIDPPYNTGQDFVYSDDYTDSIANYLNLTGQTQDGGRISSNNENSGRFHTEWLNMMFPRLKLARELLRDDGMIFISIDDSEFANTRKICDEIFGEENFLSVFVWNSSTAGGIRPKHVSQCHEYAIAYAKQIENISELYAPLSPEAVAQYSREDEKGIYREKDFAWRNVSNNSNQKYGIEAPDGSLIFPGDGYIYRFVRETFNEALSEGKVVFKETKSSPLIDETGKRSKYNIYIKKYLGSAKGAPASVPPRSIVGLSSRGSDELKDLFDGNLIFSNPKSTDYLNYLFEISLEGEDHPLILDFFAGSGTTGHTVIAQNASDGGNRRFILVQLPEPLDAKKKEQKTAADFCSSIGVPLNIAEITKERLRRAGAKVKKENPMFAGDTGFKVFKLDSSNLTEWDAAAAQADLEQTLENSVNNIKPDRTEQDVLFELLLKLGLELTTPIETRTISEKQVHSVGAGALVVCLEHGIDRSNFRTLGQGIADWTEQQDAAGGSQLVFLDNGFEDDVAKTNMSKLLEQRAEALGRTWTVRSI